MEMIKIYDEEALKIDITANCGRPYQQCSLSVMDTIADPDISFDEKGICNYYYEYLEAEKRTVFTEETGSQKLLKVINDIKKEGANKKYDSILGVSGGVDSSYLALIAKQYGLRPLLVHFDNGWNSEIAVSNIEAIITYTGFDLYTHVIDWEEFKEVQKAYFKASVIDIEVPTDLFIFGAIHKISKEKNIKYILSGWNTRTEFVMPKSFYFERKFDSINLLDIVKKNGKLEKIRKLPTTNFLQQAINAITRKKVATSFLNFIDYDKVKIKEILKKEIGWKDYGGKHFESVFTRFYQGYILPVKFNVDKRKCHLSNLIFAGQLTKGEALKQLNEPTYDLELQRQDFEYVAKKLDFTIEEFQSILEMKPKSHYDFETDEKYWVYYKRVIKLFRPLKPVLRHLLPNNKN